MPALTALNWALVQTAPAILRLSANPAVFDVRKKLDLIAQALRQHNLLDNAAALDVAARLNIDIGTLGTWQILTAPLERNNRYEADIGREFLVNHQAYTSFEKTIVNCSTRHLKDNYYVAYNDPVAPGAVLNTIAYCSTADFLAAMNEFAQKICDALNAHVGPPAFRPDALPAYVPTVGPRFESDSGAGHSCHCYAVATPGSAVTLTAAQHDSFKKVLRGVYGPPGIGTAKIEARNEWARIGGLAAIQLIIPDYERSMFDKALAA